MSNTFTFLLILSANVLAFTIDVNNPCESVCNIWRFGLQVKYYSIIKSCEAFFKPHATTFLSGATSLVSWSIKPDAFIPRSLLIDVLTNILKGIAKTVFCSLHTFHLCTWATEFHATVYVVKVPYLHADKATAIVSILECNHSYLLCTWKGPAVLWHNDNWSCTIVIAIVH